MSYDYSISIDAGLIRENLEGDVSYEQIESGLLRLGNDDRFHPDLNSLVDMRDCNLDLDLAVLAKIQSIFESVFKGGSGRTALLVDSPKNTALMMLFQKNASVRTVALFSTEEKALEWLRVPAAEV